MFSQAAELSDAAAITSTRFCGADDGMRKAVVSESLAQRRNDAEKVVAVLCAFAPLR